jgi:O-acetyl-ADP-ribose deacetylase (regulator of RNase III)
MSAKITLLQEDINQLPVDALVHCQYSQEDSLYQYNHEQLEPEQPELGQGAVVKITRPADAPWVADNMLLLKANWGSAVSHQRASLIASAYRHVLEFADTSDIRSVAFNVLGAEGESDDATLAQLCELAVRRVSEASITYNNLRKIIVCARNEQEYRFLVSALQTLQLH